MDADLLVRVTKHRVFYRSPQHTLVADGRVCTVSRFGWPMTKRPASHSTRND